MSGGRPTSVDDEQLAAIEARLAPLRNKWVPESDDGCALVATLEDADALLAALRKLRWAVAHIRNPETLRLVTPAALEAWLAAHGWRALHEESRYSRCFERTDGTGEDWPVLVPKESAREFSDFAPCIGRALAEIGRRGDFAPALVLCELLPEHGPWDAGGAL